MGSLPGPRRAYLRATCRETLPIYRGLFADRPCPTYLWQLAAQRGLVEHIPLEGGEARDERRLSGRRHFDPSL